MMLAVHIFSVLFSLCIVMLADKAALGWLRGKPEVLSAEKVALYHWLTWAGLVVTIFSGLYIALPQLSYLLSQPLFIMKICFVAILLLNSIIIGRFSKIATMRSYKSLTWQETYPLVTSGALSFFGWTGAVVLALAVFG
jgi:hypothetical protein